MDSLSTTFLVLGLAADAFAVSLTSGLLIQRIKINKALKIALFFGVFQCFMPLIGWAVGINFSYLIAKFDHWVAFGLLSFIGGKMIYESFQLETNREKFNPLDNYTLLVLAIATSIALYRTKVPRKVCKAIQKRGLMNSNHTALIKPYESD